ncbi:MAG TPA: hypothetical protein VGM63_08000 [Mucilaginibacter sp.]
MAEYADAGEAAGVDRITAEVERKKVPVGGRGFEVGLSTAGGDPSFIAAVAEVPEGDCSPGS